MKNKIKINFCSWFFPSGQELCFFLPLPCIFSLFFPNDCPFSPLDLSLYSATESIRRIFHWIKERNDTDISHWRFNFLCIKASTTYGRIANLLFGVYNTCHQFIFCQIDMSSVRVNVLYLSDKTTYRTIS